MEFDFFTGPRMNDPQPLRVKHLPSHGFDQLTKAWVQRGRNVPLSAIKGVSQERVAHRGQMDSDLVCSTRLGKDAKERHARESLQDPPSGDGGPSFLCVNGHPLSFPRVAAYGPIDHSFILMEVAGNKGKIGFFNRSVLELLREVLISLIVLCNDHDSGSAFIEPVDDPRPDDSVDSP